MEEIMNEVNTRIESAKQKQAEAQIEKTRATNGSAVSFADIVEIETDSESECESTVSKYTSAKSKRSGHSNSNSTQSSNKRSRVPRMNHYATSVSSTKVKFNDNESDVTSTSHRLSLKSACQSTNKSVIASSKSTEVNGSDSEGSMGKKTKRKQRYLAIIAQKPQVQFRVNHKIMPCLNTRK